MQLQFLTDTFQFETEATITDSGEDDDGPYVVMDRSVFYPGGGGQEPDRGTIITKEGTTIPILDATYIKGVLRYTVTEKIAKNEQVKMTINRAYRIHNAQLHTAGHLLASVVYEKLKYPLRPVKGFHYQQGAYVEFESKEEMVDIPSEEEIQKAVTEDIFRELPIEISSAEKNSSDDVILQIDSFSPLQDNHSRWITIGGYKPLPCGGTHLRNTREIGAFFIKQIHYKKGRIRINYRVGDEEN